jgi:flavin-dependent thymidylate synthase
VRVTLFDYTGRGSLDPSREAQNVLAFTKATRLNMSPDLIDDIRGKTTAEMDEQMDYMARTNPGSWEFVQFSFLIEGVTRAFTHQLVRTRTASFAQQTMRVLDVEGWAYETGPTIKNDPFRTRTYNIVMKNISDGYDRLVSAGAAIEDARGILPTNIHTNICMSCNMRTLVEMIHKRSSPRVQGEYQDFIKMAREAVVAIYPWMTKFIDRDFDKVALELNDAIMASSLSKGTRTDLIKLVDQMRAEK